MHYKSFTDRDSNSVTLGLSKNRSLILSFPDDDILRVNIFNDSQQHKSVMVKLGYIKESLSEVSYSFSKTPESITLQTKYLIVTVNTKSLTLNIKNTPDNELIKTINLIHYQDDSSETHFGTSCGEHFYGFGFQRKSFDAKGQKLIFKRGYRWDEATVPFFMSSAGYGYFSANTYDHRFDFTDDNIYSVTTTGGDTDFFIINGPKYKDIIEKYTALTGRPHMVPKWALGLCYVARLFENKAGLLDIAHRFREYQIPCDMLGVEPGWEKHYYQMKWEWNEEMFPEPKAMIDELHELGYVFELWESGDAPLSGYMDPEKRKNWFAQRVDSSLNIGVDFFKQDDPYPRCITSEEMVEDPTVDVFLQDDAGYSEEETRNIANTLYSTTVFNEMRRLTGKRAFIIFHSYGASTSSQMYPCAWAGDFKLGNGALNASLSGHAMVTQDMRNESPVGIHFGFLLPFIFMDSWAYYLDPWLFAEHITEMIRFYSRLRVSLYPYLYTALWQSHTTGLPILRPMILEYQDDSSVSNLFDQYMLGDSLLVGICSEDDASIYLPEGTWFNYWTREKIISDGRHFECMWPVYTGGPLYVREGAIIPMTNSTDSISLNDDIFTYLDVYPKGSSKSVLYNDDGITYGYESGDFEVASFECIETDNQISVMSNGLSVGKATITRVLLENIPDFVESSDFKLKHVKSLNDLLYSYISGWYYSKKRNALYIKDSNSWSFAEELADTDTFYNGKIQWTAEPITSDFNITITKSSRLPTNYIAEDIDECAIPDGSEFRIFVNPPERVRLNHGDSWLSYYIYVGFEIVHNGEIVKGAKTDVNMEIICSDNRDIVKKHNAIFREGVGHFNKIIVGSASEPPDVLLKFTAEGVKTTTIRYNPQEI